MKVDVIVVGSGGAGMGAALTAAVSGAEVLVLERTDRLGGTTTYSGGAMWIPNNRLMADVGIKDSRAEALTYLRTLTSGFVPESMLATFIDTANEMIEFFETHADFDMSCRYEQADYQPTFDGAKEGGRCIESDRIVYAHEMGEFGEAVRSSYAAIASPFHANLHTSKELAQMQRTGIDIDPEIAEQRAAQGAHMRGRGLVASLLHAGRKLGLTAMLDTSAVKLLKERERVVGVEVERDGVREQHLARLGVVLATGGFEWNAQMVHGFLGIPQLTPASPPTGLGLGLGLALEAGASISNMTNAWWDVVMHEPGQIYDGKPYYQTTTLWRGRAGTMMVNRHGRRFVNESMNYSDMGVIMKAFDPLAYEHPNMPSYILFDGALRENFRIGSLNPGSPDPEWLIRANSVAELAERADIATDGLKRQLETFNRNAARGLDPEFHRGDDPYDRYRGDPSSPHPNLRPLEPPYYAVPQTLGCLGTKGGPVTNEDAQVLDLHDRPIPGLYACGNVMSNVFGPSYPGPGATLGSGLTFGYRAGRHLTKAARRH
jgi:succinate dehydrogenase/fumarate reductase flavoprotein subunit